jgi:hypothetical protein
MRHEGLKVSQMRNQYETGSKHTARDLWECGMLWKRKETRKKTCQFPLALLENQ